MKYLSIDSVVRNLLACALIAASVAPAAAQSGRRPPPRRPDPPAATPAPAPTPAPPEAARPKTPISVAKDVANINFPHAVAKYLVGECLSRFRAVPLYAASTVRDLRRNEAIDMAKADETAYVLWLEFTTDAADNDRSAMGRPDLRNLVVRYILYAPGTGDVTIQGRLYFTADTRARAGRVLIPYGGGGRGSNYTLEEAGQKIAEHVMDSIGAPASAPMPRR